MKTQNKLSQNFIRLFLLASVFAGVFITSHPVWADGCKYSLANFNNELKAQVKSLTRFPALVRDQNGHVQGPTNQEINETLKIAGLGSISGVGAATGGIRYLLFEDGVGSAAKGFRNLKSVETYLKTVAGSTNSYTLRGISGALVGEGFGNPSVLLSSLPKNAGRWAAALGRERFVPAEEVAKAWKIAVKYVN
jgi:hypothetical protein